MNIEKTEQQIITGEVKAGATAAFRQEVEKVIANTNSSMFDLSDLLFKIKSEGLYSGYTTFSEYLKSLKFKRRRLDYLVKMAEVMNAVSIPRSKYEPLGISKLRLITSLDVNKTWKNPETDVEVPLKSFIIGFVEQGLDMTLSEIAQHVRTLKGEVGDEAFVILHIKIKQSVMDKVIRPALETMKAKIGSTGKDGEGYSIDASDGRALEMIAADWLSDPENTVIEQGEQDD